MALPVQVPLPWPISTTRRHARVPPTAPSAKADIPTFPSRSFRIRTLRGVASRRCSEWEPTRSVRALLAPGPLPWRDVFVFVPGPRGRFQTAAGRFERAAGSMYEPLTPALLRREHVKSPPPARHRVLCPAWPDRRLSPTTRVRRPGLRPRACPNSSSFHPGRREPAERGGRSSSGGHSSPSCPFRKRSPRCVASRRCSECAPARQVRASAANM
jgi:hypothetical protein